MTTPERILSIIDSGLQDSSESGAPRLPAGYCWRCTQQTPSLTPLGLCPDCDEWLHTDSTLSPGDRLLPPGTLPEEIGDRPRPFGEWDLWRHLAATQRVLERDEIPRLAPVPPRLASVPPVGAS